MIKFLYKKGNNILMRSEGEEERRNRDLRHEDLIYFTALLSLLILLLSFIYLPSSQYNVKKEDKIDVNATVESNQGEDFRNTIKFLIMTSTVIVVLFTIMRFYAVIFEDNMWRYISVHGVFTGVISFIFLFGSTFLLTALEDIPKKDLFALFAPLWFFIILVVPKFLNKTFANSLLKTSKYKNLLIEYTYSKKGIEEEIYNEEDCSHALSKKRIRNITSNFYLSAVFLFVGSLFLGAGYLVHIKSLEATTLEKNVLYILFIVPGICLVVYSVCLFLGYRQTKNKKEPKFLFWYFIKRDIKSISMKIGEYIKKHLKYVSILTVLIIILDTSILYFVEQDPTEPTTIFCTSLRWIRFLAFLFLVFLLWSGLKNKLQ